MKKTLLLLALLLAPQTIEALSIQCEGIALSTGVQCKKKIALKHNTSLCHHHKYTNHTEGEKIDFNSSDVTMASSASIAITVFVLIFIVLTIYTYFEYTDY